MENLALCGNISMEIGTLGKFPCIQYMEICLEMGVSQVKKIVQTFNGHGGQRVTAVAYHAVG
jgi:hypothetical protein